MRKSLRIGTFIPAKLFSNLLASCSLRNVDFLPLHIAHFDKSITLPFLVLTSLKYKIRGFFNFYCLLQVAPQHKNILNFYFID